MSNKIITIGREFGSGGREIGLKLALALGIECYDSRLIEMASEDGKVDIERLREVEEKKANSLLYSVYSDYTTIPNGYGLPMNDVLFNLQSKVIMELAKKESCIIIGRCADYVLKDMNDVLNVFIYADNSFKNKRIMDKYDVSEREAASMMKKQDKQRSYYYNFYTDNRWGRKESYDLTLNSSRLGIDKCVSILKDYYER